jgi:hypothetical protein
MEINAGFGHLASQQHRVIARQQALECGVDKNAIDPMIRPGGRWQRLLPGIYLTDTGTPTQVQREMAALRYAGPGGTLTGQAALAGLTRESGTCRRSTGRRPCAGTHA